MDVNHSYGWQVCVLYSSRAVGCGPWFLHVEVLHWMLGFLIAWKPCFTIANVPRELWLWDSSLSSSPHGLDPWAALPTGQKCSLCNLDPTAGLGDNLFCDFPVKMEFFFRNSDSRKAELGTSSGGEAAASSRVSTEWGGRRLRFQS